MEEAARSDAADEAADMTLRALALALECTHVEVASLIAPGATCHSWSGMTAEVLATRQHLDLRPFALTLTDEHLQSLLARAPLIKSLNIADCKLVTDASLDVLPTYCPMLTELNLACVPLVTAEAVERVVAACGPKLVSLELQGCRSISGVDMVSKFARFLEIDDDEDGLSKVQG